MNAKRWIAVAAACGFGIAICTFLYQVWRDPFDDRTFTSSVWLTSSPHSRGYMARDAARSTIGLYPREIVAMLGTPQERATNDATEWKTLAYDLGTWSNRGFGRVRLMILVNEHGLVQSAEIWAHGESGQPLHRFPNRG